jgi:hypothetical protein
MTAQYLYEFIVKIADPTCSVPYHLGCTEIKLVKVHGTSLKDAIENAKWIYNVSDVKIPRKELFR